MVSLRLQSKFQFIKLTILLICSGFVFPALGADCPRIALLAGSFGTGHNSTADNVGKYLKQKYPCATIRIYYAEDFVAMADRGGGEVVKNKFSFIYQKYPSLYDVFWQGTMKVANLAKTAVGLSHFPFRTHRLWQALTEFDPEVVISTHHFSTLMAIELFHLKVLTRNVLRLFWLNPDFVARKFFTLISASPYVEKTFQLDKYLTDRFKNEFDVPEDKLIISGVPVDDAVYEEFSDAERAKFMEDFLQKPDNPKDLTQGTWVNGEDILPNSGKPPKSLDPDATRFIISSGGDGVGDYVAFFKGAREAAAKRNVNLEVWAICGKNTTNRERLIAYWNSLKPEDRKGLTLVISGYVRDKRKMIHFSKISHGAFGKAGVSGPFELFGKALVLGNFVGGQEGDGAKHYARAGAAKIVNLDEQHLAGEMLFSLLESPAELEKMTASQKIMLDAYTMEPYFDVVQHTLNHFKKITRVSIRGLPKLPPDIFTRMRKILRCQDVSAPGSTVKYVEIPAPNEQ